MALNPHRFSARGSLAPRPHPKTDRLLAYVFLEDGSCFDLELIASGYGLAYVKYPFFFMDEFKNAELGARYEKKGLWGR